MQPTSTSSSSLFSKRSTSMARASVFVDPQPTTPQSEDYARPSSIFTTTTSRQPNLVESTSKSSSALLAPIGVRRAFGELTNHHRQQQQQPDTPRFQSHKKLPLSSNNLMAFNPQHAPPPPPPTKPQQQQQQQDDNPSSSSSRFHAHSFDPFGTGMDPFGLNQLGLAANTAPFGQRTTSTINQSQHVSRHICVSHLPVGTDPRVLVETLQTFGAISHVYPEYLHTNRSLTVSYYDLRSATQAVNALQALGDSFSSNEYQHVQVDFFSDSKLSFLHHGGDNDGDDIMSTEAATVIVTMLSSGARDKMDAFDYKGFFQHWGDIRSILPLDSFPDRLIVQIEFYDTRAAERIISQVHEQVYEGIIFHVSHPPPPSSSSRARPTSNQWSDGFLNRLGTTNNNFDISENVSQQQQHLAYPFGPSLLYSQHHGSSHHDDTMQPSNSFSLFANSSNHRRLPPPSPSMVVAPPGHSHHVTPSLENRASLQVAEDNIMEEVAIISSERRPSVATRSSSVSSLRATTTSPDHNSSNIFDIQRVMDGLDTRTTFMIRNIPNKYTQQMLKESIDATHYGTYDFLYLRIDFQNKCNVGYAFINFIDVKSVISFAQERVGKRWSRFNSEKRCSLSYANIQGKEALVEKFRNSTVMDEPPSYRPMLFYSSGPHVGEQQPFPEPTVSAETRHQRRRRTSGSQRQEKKQ